MSRWTALRSAFGERRGTAAVELVLWLPFFLVLLAIVTDLSLILKFQTRMYDVAAQASRSVSYGSSTASAESFARNQFPNDNVTVSVTLDETETWVTTVISSNFGEPMLFGAGLFKDHKFGALDALDPGKQMHATAAAYIITPYEAPAEEDDGTGGDVGG